MLAFLLLHLHSWRPHEDEVLALFVGRGSLGATLGTVIGRRGGAPLHFLVAWAVVHAGGGLTALRALSAVFATASVPVVALLGARLAGRAAGLGAAVVASASWLLLFYGVFGRMYSLFLLTSALSYLALLAAVDGGGRRRWTLWAVAALAMLASHPYGALVLASQAVWALAAARRRDTARAFGAVIVLATPFWYADVVLRGRFDVGLGGGGAQLNGVGAVASYFRQAAQDATSGFTGAFWASLTLAGIGLAAIAWRRRSAAALAVLTVVVPALAFLAARLGGAVAPQTRHLVFVLPFFTTCVAAGVVACVRPLGRVGLPVAVAACGALAYSGVAWAHHRAPELFRGESAVRAAARAEASAWLASTALPNDVLLGYDPLYLAAWERQRSFPHFVVPRADPRLAAAALRGRDGQLGRGVWVIDASDQSQPEPSLTIPLTVPEPREAFEARVFGPYLVVRSVAPTVTAKEYLTETAAVMRVGRAMGNGNADVDLHTALVALTLLG